MESFSLKIGKRQGYPLTPVLFNIILEFLAIIIKQDKETKDIQIGTVKAKLPLFTGDMILYLKDLKTPSKNSLK
jgi:hypothetical protein